MVTSSTRGPARRSGAARSAPAPRAATSSPAASTPPSRSSRSSRSRHPTSPFPCLGPLDRELAVQGGGVTGTTRAAISTGFRLTVYVDLAGALPNTQFDVYVDTGGGTAGTHVLVGSFTTDSLGNRVFTGSVDVATVGMLIDNELVLHNASASSHQYIRTLFAPCPE